MCDTLVALGNSTADGSVLFAKNSDREANEAQGLVYFPPALHRSDETVKCTFIEIPQVRETLGVILSKPFWMFGCEMGANEAGVVMGNEAVFTKLPYATTGLTGMDLMRLALERADTAHKALYTIIELMGKYGQCALGGYRHTIKYHNAFIIADAKEAYVLETAGPHWVVEKVRDVRSISNGLSIGSEWDDASPGLVEYAVQRGWCRSKAEFHFARCYREPIYTFFSASYQRHACTSTFLQEHKGRLTPRDLARLLRDHGPHGQSPDWRPEQGLLMQVCAHASWGPIRGGGAQTAGSMIAQLRPDGATFWFTGTAAPCTGIFKPVRFVAGERLPAVFGPEPGATYDERVRWWRHEVLHRAVLLDYPTRMALYRDERDALEGEFFAGGEGPDFVEECFARADAAEQEWTRRVRAAPVRRRPGLLYRRYWEAQNRAAQMPALA
jgi:secernin